MLYSCTQGWKRSQVRRGATGRGLRRLMQQGTTTQIWRCMPASVIVFLCRFSFMSSLEGQRGTSFTCKVISQPHDSWNILKTVGKPGFWREQSRQELKEHRAQVKLSSIPVTGLEAEPTSICYQSQSLMGLAWDSLTSVICFDIRLLPKRECVSVFKAT